MNQGEKIHSAFVKAVHSLASNATIVMGYRQLKSEDRQGFIRVLEKRKTAILVLLDLAEKVNRAGFFSGEKGKLEKEFAAFFYELKQGNKEQAWAAADLLIPHFHTLQDEMKTRLGVIGERPHKSVLELMEEGRQSKRGKRAA